MLRPTAVAAIDLRLREKQRMGRRTEAAAFAQNSEGETKSRGRDGRPSKEDQKVQGWTTVAEYKTGHIFRREGLSRKGGRNE